MITLEKNLDPLKEGNKENKEGKKERKGKEKDLERSCLESRGSTKKVLTMIRRVYKVGWKMKTVG